ncbi:unnamed protein product [Rotaria sordida]|uniref:DUF4326 domain-containing protein n=1 Tax=Rotaria sordida TaxID=392033 RepID=A0A814JXQ4_9BILA|nr:unnamed protein product [Rotaria sordida]CAF1043463.1 unnamed protein product [Rotaria sordida]CAF3795670.1 unnamed protein product [Rotaria sordida]CAF3797824.1 unnamed protein product [Rotaria sordida]
MQSETKRKNIDEPTDIRSKLLKLDKSTNETQFISNLPTVVHLRRSKGKIVQDCDIYIGRACNMGGWQLNQSKWYNPYSVKQYGRDGALDRYEKYIESNPNNLLNDLHELAGKRLGCWCKPNRCHGYILCELFKKRNSTIDQSIK